MILYSLSDSWLVIKIMFHILNTITVSGELSLTDIVVFPRDRKCLKFTAKFSFQFTQQFGFANVDENNNKELIQHAILLFINSVSSEKLKLLLLRDATNEIN